jgi:hypothetical protein
MEELVTTIDGEPTVFGDAGQLAAHLRTRDALIVCSPACVEIEEPTIDDAEPSCRAADVVGQLVLPIPLSSFNRRDPRTQNRDRAMLKPRSKTQNPHRDPPKRE